MDGCWVGEEAVKPKMLTGLTGVSSSRMRKITVAERNHG